MEHQLYDAYLAICGELGLEASLSSQFDRLRRMYPSGACVRLLGEVVATWVLVRDDCRDGCATCLTSIAAFIEHFYSGDEDAVFSAEDAAHLLTAFHEIHDLSIAVTNAYGAQNWSCVVPASDCAECAGTRGALTPAAIRDVTRDFAEEPPDPNDTGGERSRSAKEFVAQNRWAVGFASVVGNPVQVPESTYVTLVNAPIRTSRDPLRCEIAGGKGIDLHQALASFLGEALERYALATADRRFALRGVAAAVERAIDVARTFGFPVVDGHPSITPLDQDTELEWLDAIDLAAARNIRLPVNFALCPYVGGSFAVIVPGSTNGAASGITHSDARHQALREIVERDAFWYYARTGVQPIHIDLETLPRDIAGAMSDFDGKFAVALLPNPFDAPVAHVTFQSSAGFRTKSARGSGHGSTVVGSVRRAFAECIQMLYSLDSGLEVEPVDTDMRGLWFEGEAFLAMPNLFVAGELRESLEDATLRFIEHQGFEQMIESADRQGARVFEILLAEEPTFAVSKIVLSCASVCDATYFEACDRLADFAALMAHPEPTIQYRGSLFM